MVGSFVVLPSDIPWNDPICDRLRLWMGRNMHQSGIDRL